MIKKFVFIFLWFLTVALIKRVTATNINDILIILLMYIPIFFYMSSKIKAYVFVTRTMLLLAFITYVFQVKLSAEFFAQQTYVLFILTLFRLIINSFEQK